MSEIELHRFAFHRLGETATGQLQMLLNRSGFRLKQLQSNQVASQTGQGMKAERRNRSMPTKNGLKSAF